MSKHQTPGSSRELVSEVPDLAAGEGTLAVTLAPFALPALALPPCWPFGACGEHSRDGTPWTPGTVPRPWAARRPPRRQEG